MFQEALWICDKCLVVQSTGWTSLQDQQQRLLAGRSSALINNSVTPGVEIITHAPDLKPLGADPCGAAAQRPEFLQLRALPRLAPVPQEHGPELVSETNPKLLITAALLMTFQNQLSLACWLVEEGGKRDISQSSHCAIATQQGEEGGGGRGEHYKFPSKLSAGSTWSGLLVLAVSVAPPLLIVSQSFLLSALTAHYSSVMSIVSTPNNISMSCIHPMSYSACSYTTEIKIWGLNEPTHSILEPRNMGTIDMKLLHPGWVQEVCMNVKIHVVKVTPNLSCRLENYGVLLLTVTGFPLYLCSLLAHPLHYFIFLCDILPLLPFFSYCVFFSQKLFSLLLHCISLNPTSLTAVFEQLIIHSSSTAALSLQP